MEILLDKTFLNETAIQSNDTKLPLWNFETKYQIQDILKKNYMQDIDNPTKEDYVNALEEFCFLFSDIQAYLDWYYEDESPKDVIEDIINSPSKEAFLTKKLDPISGFILPNGAVIRIEI